MGKRFLPEELVMVREVNWRDEDGIAVIIAPRFGKGFLCWFLRRLFKNPFIRLKLDEMGTHVWKMCDGSYTIGEIVKSLEETFGDDAGNARERVDFYLRGLHRQHWLSFLKATDVAAGDGEDPPESKPPEG